MRKCTLLKAERGCFYEEENYTAILSGAVAIEYNDVCKSEKEIDKPLGAPVK